MTDAAWADVSEHQRPVDNSYPYPVFATRSNDGTYLDPGFAHNHAWAKAATDSGRLAFFIVYLVYYPNWQDGVAALQRQVGTPHPGMVVMIDVESWPVNGVPTIAGDQSAGITAQRDAIAAWLGDHRRVIAYGNKGDLNILYPRRPADLRLVIASYGSPPDVGFPGFIAQQYTDAGPCPPFGVCDMNTAPGLTTAQLATTLGITTGDPAMAGYADWDQRSRDQFWTDLAITITQPDGANPPRRPDVAGSLRDTVWSMVINGVQARDRLQGIDAAANAAVHAVSALASSPAMTPAAVGGVDPKAIAAEVVAALGPQLAAQVATHLTITTTPGV